MNACAGRAARAAVAGIAFALGACTVGPDYTRPDLDLPQAHPVALDRERGAALADVAWFELFDDTELTSLIGEAIAGNLDLQAALGRVIEARQRARLAGAQLLPNVIGGLANSPSPLGANNTAYTLGVGLAWEIDFFGKLRRASEAAAAEALATEEGARALTVSLVAAVASTYFSVRELDRRIEIVERTIESQTASLTLVRSLKASGVVSAAEENQALSLVASTRAQLPALRQQRIAAQNALAVLLGDAPRPGLVAANEASTPPDLGDFSVGLPTDLVAARPDIRAAEQRLQAATARVGVAIANRFPFPTLGLSAFAGWLSLSLADIVDSEGGIFSWGPTGSVPLLDFGRTDAAVKIADAQLIQATLAYRNAVITGLREVADALAGLDAADEIIEHTRTRVEAAYEVRRLQQLRFRQGAVAYLEVLDAERQLLGADLALAQAEYGKVQQFVALYRALGGGADEARLTETLEALRTASG